MKALETEYKKQISLEIPDLWSRIEAGVDEYERAKTAEAVNAKADKEIDSNANKITDINSTKADDKVTDGYTTTVNENETALKNTEADGISEVRTAKISSFNKKKTFVMIGKIVGAAACIMLAMTVVFNFGTRKNETTSAFEAPAAADAGCSEEATTVTEESYDMSDEAPIDSHMGIRGENDVNYSKEMMDETEESVMDYEEAIPADETVILMESLECTSDEASDILAILKEYEIGEISDAVVVPTDSIMESELYDSADINNVKVLLMTDTSGKQYCIVTEYIDGELVLKMIREDDLNGEIIYQN